MTGTELKTFTENILDGETIDTDFFYQLLNVAKEKLESKRVWHYLKKLNSSNTAGVTAGYTLPTDFAGSYKVIVNTNEYTPISFDEQHLFSTASLRYYIDLPNDKFVLTGTPASATIYFYYKKFTDDITSSTEPVFPDRYHPILGYYVASYYQGGIDSDDTFARMSPENRLAGILLEQSMDIWDTSITLEAKDNRLGIANSQPQTALEQM